jgi:fluoroacetyl-CoA thioesterase
MVALMESASVAAIQKDLREGETSVGTEISVRHFAPTPVGMHVRAHAVLLGIEGRHLNFRVEAWDDKEKIGEGSLTRAIVDAAWFAKRLKVKFGA